MISRMAFIGRMTALGFGMAVGISLPFFPLSKEVRAETDQAAFMEILGRFLEQYPETHETLENLNQNWSVTNEALAGFGEFLNSSQKAFMFGAAVSAGGSVGTLAVEGIVGVLEMGGAALVEALTHEKRDRKRLQACVEGGKFIQEGSLRARDLERKISADILMRELVAENGVRIREIEERLKAQRIVVESYQNAERRRFDAIQAQETALVFGEDDGLEVQSAIEETRSAKELSLQNLVEFDSWLLENQLQLALLELISRQGLPTCDSDRASHRELLRLERDLQGARARVLEGESAWMRFKAREMREADRAIRTASTRGFIGEEVRHFRRELERLNDIDIRPLELEQRRLFRSEVLRCLRHRARGDAHSSAVRRLRLKYGAFASDAELWTCEKDAQSLEGYRTRQTQIDEKLAQAGKLDARIEERTRVLSEASGREGASASRDLQRRAMLSDLEWFESIRKRYEEVEQSRSGELERLADQITRSGGCP